MSKKQSSVDYLFNKLWETPKDKIAWFRLLVEAKDMHEEEIIDACLFGHDNKEWHYRLNYRDYYNENFNQ